MKNLLVNKLPLINIVLLQFIVFSLPLYQKFIPLLIVLFALTVLILFFKSYNKFTLSKANLLLLCFYSILGLGLIWSENIEAGTFDLEVKMSLFIFPILFSLIEYEKTVLQKVIRSLVYGVILFFTVALYFAYKTYIVKDDGLHYFLYSRLSPIVHPSYMSMYIVVAIAFVLKFIKEGVYVFYSQKLSLLVVGLLFVINFMVLSKIGIIISVLLLFYYVFIWIKSSKRYFLGSSLIMSILVLFYMSYINVGYVAQRVDEFVSVFDNEKDNSNKSSGVRVHIWKHAVTLIQEKPILGHGTGDVKDVLIKKYEENNLTLALKHGYNAHNQFFQILISSGVIGLVLFLLSSYLGAKSSSLFLSFVIITFFYMSVESILENQAGTIFFGLFFSLLSQKSLVKL